MYSTEHNVTHLKPDCSTNTVCGKHLFHPKPTDGNQFETGMRCRGSFKRSLPGKPLISVITTVLNAELTLERAICSVLCQTYNNIEYIVVDAESTDRSMDIAMKYEDVIDYIVSARDDGLYEGMNKGIELAQGDYIIIINADDWYVSECIETLTRHATEKSLDFVSALAVETDAHGKIIRHIPRIPLNNSIRFRMTLRHETMLISRQLYNSVGLYDASYRIIADLKFTQRLYRLTQNFTQLNEYLMHFRKIGIAHKVTDRLLEERKKLLVENFGFLDGEDVKLLAIQYSKNRIDDYRRLASKYSGSQPFVDALRDFLELHGAGL